MKGEKNPEKYLKQHHSVLSKITSIIDLYTLVLVEERTADLDEHCIEYSILYICYSSPNTSDLTISMFE
jgi:hypothetical protein